MRFSVGEVVAKTDGCPPFVIKGHLSLEQAIDALCEDEEREEDERPDPQNWRVRHEWSRCVPCKRWCPEYEFLVYPATPHSRGAFPSTELDLK